MTHLITASNDKTAKLVDARSFEVLKVYKAGSPVYAADMSPTHDYVRSLEPCFQSEQHDFSRLFWEEDKKPWTWQLRDQAVESLNLVSSTK